MSTRNAKAAKLRLKMMGIEENDPRLAPREILVGYRTVPEVHPDDMQIAGSMRNLTQTKFRRIPIMRRINPYRQLLKAEMEGTFTEEKRKEMIALLYPEITGTK